MVSCFEMYEQQNGTMVTGTSGLSSASVRVHFEQFEDCDSFNTY